jgi:transcriptional regulator with XRE-family HTH domain
MENSYTICEILGYIVIMWEIGERLRERRKAAELTQGQVVAYGDIGKTYLSNLEKGVNTPNWDLLGRLARRYKTTADYILGLTSDPRPVTEQKPLPEGATEIVKYLGSMSERGRAELLAIAKTIFDADQRWQTWGRLKNIIEALGGHDQLLQILDDESIVPAGFMLDGVGLTFDADTRTIRIMPLEQIPHKPSEPN